MGIDVGFDMFPLLNNNDIDNNKWNSFFKRNYDTFSRRF